MRTAFYTFGPATWSHFPRKPTLPQKRQIFNKHNPYLVMAKLFLHSLGGCSINGPADRD